MDTVLLCDQITANNTGTSPAFNPFVVGGAGYTWQATVPGSAQSVVPIAGKIRDLVIMSAVSPDSIFAGATWTWTLYVNGAASALTATLTGTNLTVADHTNEVTVAAGDLLSMGFSFTGGYAAGGARCQWGAILRGTTGGQSFISATNFTPTDSALTTYIGVQGNAAPSTVAGTEVEQVIPAAGTLRNMYLRANGAAGLAKSVTVTLYKNGAAQTLTCQIAGAAATTANDLVHSVAVAAGDRLYLEVVPVGVPGTNARTLTVAFEFDPTIDGESVQCVGPNKTATNNGTARYYAPAGNTTPTITEANINGIVPRSCSARNLYAYCQTNPGAAKSYTFALSKNTVAGNPQATLTNTQTGNDLVNSTALIAGDTVSIKVTPAGAPAASLIEAGFVTFVPPTMGGTLPVMGVG